MAAVSCINNERGAAINVIYSSLFLASSWSSWTQRVPAYKQSRNFFLCYPKRYASMQLKFQPCSFLKVYDLTNGL